MDLVAGAVVVLAVLAMAALIVALLVASWRFLTRAGELVAETREAEEFRQTVGDLTERAAASLDGLAHRVDAVRHRSLDAAEIVENLEAAAEAVARYRDEVDALEAPRAHAQVRNGMEHALARADRAIAMIEHGVALLGSGRPRGKEVEAETSIKRGYLNLLHAREELSAQAARASTNHALRRARIALRRRRRAAASDHRM